MVGPAGFEPAISVALLIERELIRLRRHTP